MTEKILTEREAVRLDLHEVQCLLRGTVTEVQSLAERSIKLLNRLGDIERAEQHTGTPPPSPGPLGAEESVKSGTPSSEEPALYREGVA